MLVVKLSMQYCELIFKDSFETYKTFPRCIVTEFEWVRFQNRVFKLLNNDEEK